MTLEKSNGLGSCSILVGLAGDNSGTGIAGLALLLRDNKLVGGSLTGSGLASIQVVDADLTGPLYELGGTIGGLIGQHGGYAVRIKLDQEALTSWLERRPANDSVGFAVIGRDVRPWPEASAGIGEDSIRVELQCAEEVSYTVKASQDLVLASHDDFEGGLHARVWDTSVTEDAFLLHEFGTDDVQVFAGPRNPRGNEEGTLTVRGPGGVHTWDIRSGQYFSLDSDGGAYRFELERRHLEIGSPDRFFLTAAAWTPVGAPDGFFG